MGNISQILKNEIQLEFKSKSSVGSIFLFVFSSTFTAYLAFKSIDNPLIWNGIFWLMILFASINGTANSFKESNGLNTYLHNIVSSRELIYSKMLFNAITLLILTFLCLGCYTLFMGSFIGNHFLFFSACFVGSLCIASVLTLSSGISHKASGNSSLFNVLSIPVLIPVLILLITASIDSLKNNQYTDFVTSEMYAGEIHFIKAELLNTNEVKASFKDEDNNIREINISGNKLEVNKSYIIETKYNDESFQFETNNIYPVKDKNYQSSWVKIITIGLVNLIIILIAHLIFPKFWTE